MNDATTREQHSGYAGENAEAALVDLERCEVKLTLMSDPAVYQAELRRIFGREWNFVCHVSEIPAAGDYVTRFIGNDPVVVARQSDGTIRTFANRCAHKGAMICRDDRGRAARFTCPYHGFTYSRDGEFLAMPQKSELYGHVDKTEYNLSTARTEVLYGLVFANWDHAARSLFDSFGAYNTILKLTFDRDIKGMEVIGPPQRWVVKANWKMVSEQFSGDGYHATSTHASMLDAKTRDKATKGVDVSANGSGARCIDLAGAWGHETGKGDSLEAQLHARPPAGMTSEMVDQFIATATREELFVLVNYPPSVGNMFPNCSWMRSALPDVATGEVVTYTDIKLARPLSETETEIWAWGLIERSATPDHNAKALSVRTIMFGPAGTVERDDVDMWQRIQVAVNGAFGRGAVAKYRALWAPEEPLLPDLKTWRGYSGENTSWHFFVRWREAMLQCRQGGA